jgi:thiol-disulfide isomerase/thioredoxin
MKQIYCLMIILWPVVSTGQTVKPLLIGNIMPDVAFQNMTNYKTNSGKLSDFKGDLILLDFWGTWCSACLQSFPKMDSLKKEFKSVQILLVNTKSRISKDNEQKIQNTLKRLNQRTGSDIRLPVVYNNDRLDALFPLKYIPQVIWISKNKVIAITGSEEVTAKNISTVLNRGVLNVSTKKDLLSFDPDKLLFENGNGGEPRQILFRSLITGYIQGIGERIGYRMQNNKINGVFLLNQSLLNIVKDVYRDSMPYPDNRIFIESANPKLHKSNDASATDLFCYELNIPPSSEKQIKQYMKMDLKKYFGITVHNDKRKMKCLVLQRSNQSKATSESLKDKRFDLQKNTLKKYIHNRNVSSAVRLLNLYSTLPIVDESNDKGDISLDLPFDLADVKGLQSSFNKAGFTLNEEERQIEVTIISDH